MNPIFQFLHEKPGEVDGQRGTFIYEPDRDTYDRLKLILDADATALQRGVHSDRSRRGDHAFIEVTRRVADYVKAAAAVGYRFAGAAGQRDPDLWPKWVRGEVYKDELLERHRPDLKLDSRFSGYHGYVAKVERRAGLAFWLKLTTVDALEEDWRLYMERVARPRRFRLRNP